MQQRFINISPLQGLVFLFLIIIGGYFMLRGLYWLASMLMPVLLIATLIINYKVVLDFGKMLVEAVRREPIMGVLGIIMTLVLLPLVVLFLFAKALFQRKAEKFIKEQQTQYENKNGKYVEYEEVVVPKKQAEKAVFIELPPIKEKEAKPIHRTPPPKNQYDDFFEQ